MNKKKTMLVTDPDASDETSAPQARTPCVASQRRLGTRASELLQDQSRGLPVWIRSPKSGVEFYSGFSRAKLYEGAGKGHFRSVSIRDGGQTKGTRLFNLQSILDFIERCEQQGMEKA
jgi:hypothetical protein